MTATSRRLAVATALTATALFTAAPPATADEGPAAPPKLTAATLEAAHEAASAPATLDTLSRFFAREGAVARTAAAPRIEAKTVPVRSLSAEFVAGRAGPHRAPWTTSPPPPSPPTARRPPCGRPRLGQQREVAGGEHRHRRRRGPLHRPGGPRAPRRHGVPRTADRRLVRPRRLPGAPAGRGRHGGRGGAKGTACNAYPGDPPRSHRPRPGHRRSHRPRRPGRRVPPPGSPAPSRPPC
ncbi:hypothetical protein SMICM304S_09172 [Streptomyces microflavus]